MQICTLCLLDVLVTSECYKGADLLDSCPGFKFCLVNIKAGPSRKICVSDEMLYECYKRINIVIFPRANVIVTVNEYENFVMS
jgi:hypothetical protein